MQLLELLPQRVLRIYSVPKESGYLEFGKLETVGLPAESSRRRDQELVGYSNDEI